jgi:hypothetical protein
MQRLVLGLKLYDLVPEGGHLDFNAIDHLALFEDPGAERLLALTEATTASNTAIGSRQQRKRTDKDKTPPSVDSELRGPLASNKIGLLGGMHRT